MCLAKRWNQFGRIALGVVWLLGFWGLPASAEDRSSKASAHVFDEQVRPFLARHCFHCHGERRQEAGLRLDALGVDFDRIDQAGLWVEVMDRLNGGTMPPETEPEPDIRDLTIVADWIAEQVREAAARRQSTGGRVVLRRLNRAEYDNTIRDLFGVDFRPAADFPADPPANGFDNIGAALQVSPMLIEKYLDAARDVVDRAIVEGPRPESHTWHMEVERGHPDFRDADGYRRAGNHEVWVRDPVSERHRYLIQGGGLYRDDFVVLKGVREEPPAGFRWFRIPEAGEYTIRVRAAAVVPDLDAILDSAQRVVWEAIERDEEVRDLSPAEKRRRRQEWLQDEWLDLEHHFRTDPMYNYGSPRLKLTNGSGAVIGEVSVEATLDDPQVYEFKTTFAYRPDETDAVEITNAYEIPSVLENWFREHSDFARPELWIDWVELEGVYTDEGPWPPESHRRILGMSKSRSRSARRSNRNEVVRAREVLSRFLPRAYRRPVSDSEVEAMLDLFRQVRRYKPSFEAAIKVPLIATLTSPHFLYLVEPETVEADARRPLNDFEVASRLSYFLWSSMPDADLFALADSGGLRDPEVLREQVDRMLADPKSSAFVTNFVGQWLDLRELGANPPVENLYPRYDRHLELSMIGESEAFFREILDRDLPIQTFLDSDFVMVNQRLARFYGIPGVLGDRFRRVDVPRSVRRGGLLTQASVLTLTSNGTRTSPVIRGVWVLENLLGDPPPPPPPDAGDLAPEVPGIDKATVRDRLTSHRRIPQCASCHRKIDPLGFALENYDAHGRWRDQYGFGYNGRVNDDDPPVDASGRLPDGRRFRGVDDLQRILVKDDEPFLTCLTEKLLTYALGRGVEAIDRPERDRLVEQLDEHGDTLRGLIKGIVTSDLFLTR